MGGIGGVHATRTRPAALAALHTAGTRLAEECARAPPAPDSLELQSAVELARCAHRYEFINDDASGLTTFQAGPGWMRDFAATSRPLLCSMTATQLEQLMQLLNTSTWDFGPEWLAAWRAAATHSLPHATDDEAASIVYAHGRVVARTVQWQPATAAAGELGCVANTASRTAAAAAAAAGAAGAPSMGPSSAMGPRAAAATMRKASPGELGPFLAAAAQRLKKLKVRGAKRERYQANMQYLGNMGKGLLGMQLVLHLLAAQHKAALVALPATVALCEKTQHGLEWLLAPSNDTDGSDDDGDDREDKYESMLQYRYEDDSDAIKEILLHSVGHILSGLVALSSQPPPVSLVWRYKRTLGACLPDYSAIKTLYPRDFASALGPLVAYKDRMGDCSHLSDEERERVHSTDWMDDAEERIEDIVFERRCEEGMFFDAGCLIEMVRGLRMCGKRWNKVLDLAEEDGLLLHPDSFSDAQLWALVCELRASGRTAAAAATQGVHRSALTGDASEDAAREAHKQRKWTAVAQRVTRHLATLPAEQRTAALAELEMEYTFAA